jgi:hypothetical protein
MARTADTRQRQLQQSQRAHEELQQRLAENRQRIPSKRQHEKHVRISVTDPEAALGKDKLKVYSPLYNVQLLRDLDSPFLLAYDTFARGCDAGTLVPLLRRAEQLSGHRPETVLVDSGDVTALDLADAQALRVDLYGPWKENDYSGPQAKPGKQYSKDAFLWEQAAGQYRCPQGQPLRLVGVQNRPRSLGRTEEVAISRESQRGRSTAWARDLSPTTPQPAQRMHRHDRRVRQSETLARTRATAWAARVTGWSASASLNCPAGSGPSSSASMCQWSVPPTAPASSRRCWARR